MTPFTPATPPVDKSHRSILHGFVLHFEASYESLRETVRAKLGGSVSAATLTVNRVKMEPCIEDHTLFFKGQSQGTNLLHYPWFNVCYQRIYSWYRNTGTSSLLCFSKLASVWTNMFHVGLHYYITDTSTCWLQQPPAEYTDSPLVCKLQWLPHQLHDYCSQCEASTVVVHNGKPKALFR